MNIIFNDLYNRKNRSGILIQGGQMELYFSNSYKMRVGKVRNVYDVTIKLYDRPYINSAPVTTTWHRIKAEDSSQKLVGTYLLTANQDGKWQAVQDSKKLATGSTDDLSSAQESADTWAKDNAPESYYSEYSLMLSIAHRKWSGKESYVLTFTTSSERDTYVLVFKANEETKAIGVFQDLLNVILADANFNSIVETARNNSHFLDTAMDYGFKVG